MQKFVQIGPQRGVPKHLWHHPWIRAWLDDMPWNLILIIGKPWRPNLARFTHAAKVYGVTKVATCFRQQCILLCLITVIAVALGPIQAVREGPEGQQIYLCPYHSQASTRSLLTPCDLAKSPMDAIIITEGTIIRILLSSGWIFLSSHLRLASSLTTF